MSQSLRVTSFGEIFLVVVIVIIVFIVVGIVIIFFIDIVVVVIILIVVVATSVSARFPWKPNGENIWRFQNLYSSIREDSR